MCFMKVISQTAAINWLLHTLEGSLIIVQGMFKELGVNAKPNIRRKYLLLLLNIDLKTNESGLKTYCHKWCFLSRFIGYTVKKRKCKVLLRTWFDRQMRGHTPIIRLIPQGTVDNNLGPDRLAGPMAPTIADNQPFYYTTFFCMS